MKKFEGEIEQMPPPYSAKKYKGDTLYNLVRRKKEYELKSTKVVIHYFRLKKYFPPHLDFETQCSSGTYIRSIAHDLGQNLGCGAHLQQLVRTEIGEFHIDKSHTMEEIEEMFSAGQSKNFLLPIEILLPEFPRIVVSDKTTLLVRSGSEFLPNSFPSVFPSQQENDPIRNKTQQIFRIFDTKGSLLAYASKKPEKNSLHPFLVFNPKNSSC
jgi:tRNA pseudouridine55 synthase